jgi:uncharacterized protein YybS (DUF2232 family)
MSPEAPVSAPARAAASAEPRAFGILVSGGLSAVLFVPWLLVLGGFIPGMVSPLPLMVLRLRAGLTFTLLATALSVALVAGLFDPAGAVIYFCFLAVPGLLIAEAMARGRGLLRGCAWAFLLLSVQIGLALVFAGGPMAARVVDSVDVLVSPEFMEGLKASWTADQVAEWTTQVTQLHEVMEIVYPAIYIIFGALIVLANAALLRAYLLRRDPGWLEGDEFEGIRWPSVLSMAFVLAGAAVALPAARAAAYNVLLVLAFFFALQGLAVSAFYAHRLAGPRFLRVAVVVLVLVNPWAPYILALLGLFDIFFNFRKWALPPEAREG